MRMDKAHCPRCLLRYGWLPTLSGVNGASPCAFDASESAAYLVEVALGRYSSGLIAEWDLSGDFDRDDAAASLTDHPDVWTDGSLVLDRVTGVSSSGSGFFAYQDERCWRGCRWGHVDGIHPDLHRAYCRGFCSVPGPLQYVQRAEMWGVILTSKFPFSMILMEMSSYMEQMGIKASVEWSPREGNRQADALAILGGLPVTTRSSLRFTSCSCLWRSSLSPSSQSFL